jgi:hypothetical protein
MRRHPPARRRRHDHIADLCSARRPRRHMRYAKTISRRAVPAIPRRLERSRRRRDPLSSASAASHLKQAPRQAASTASFSPPTHSRWVRRARHGRLVVARLLDIEDIGPIHDDRRAFDRGETGRTIRMKQPCDLRCGAVDDQLLTIAEMNHGPNRHRMKATCVLNGSHGPVETIPAAPDRASASTTARIDSRDRSTPTAATVATGVADVVGRVESLQLGCMLRCWCLHQIGIVCHQPDVRESHPSLGREAIERWLSQRKGSDSFGGSCASNYAPGCSLLPMALPRSG